MSQVRAGGIKLRRVDLDAFDEVAAGLDVTVCQTPEWHGFLRASQGSEPLLAEMLRSGERIGIFTGALVNKAGFRILGSPLRGWTTSYMGFALRDDADQRYCLKALMDFTFGELRCAHLELLDRFIRAELYDSSWRGKLLRGYELDLRHSEDELLNMMSPACRRCIRKAEKSGLVIEEVFNTSGYAHEYHNQLQQVFARQGLAPSYSERRVEQLIEALHPFGMLLLLRARDDEGRVIATSIFPGCGLQMYFWGGASVPEGLLNRPNEAMMWRAMRWWKARGVQRFDMGGGGSYKAKYGGAPISVPWMSSSSSPAVAALRTTAEKLLRLKQRLGRHRRRP